MRNQCKKRPEAQAGKSKTGLTWWCHPHGGRVIEQAPRLIAVIYLTLIAGCIAWCKWELGAEGHSAVMVRTRRCLRDALVCLACLVDFVLSASRDAVGPHLRGRNGGCCQSQEHPIDMQAEFFSTSNTRTRYRSVLLLPQSRGYHEVPDRVHYTGFDEAIVEEMDGEYTTLVDKRRRG